jgi:hypothetical protein
MINSLPRVIERRRQLYAEEMKEKQIYGQPVDLNYRTLEKESTRAKDKRTNGIISINGIAKDQDPLRDPSEKRIEYM